MVGLLCAGEVYAQGARVSSDPVVLSGSGKPIAGVKVAVCQPLATTAATANGSLVTYTMASNPITAGFASGGTMLIQGFTGGDTVFNAGGFSGSPQSTIINGLPILSVSSTSITAAASFTRVAASNGTILQMGTSTIPCAGLVPLYTDASLTTTTTNPLTADGYGNYGAGLASGTYYAQIYGPTVPVSIRQFVSSGGVGSIASTQVAFGSGTGITSDSNFVWDNTNKRLVLNSTTGGTTLPAGCLIYLTNSSGGTTIGCIAKQSDNSLTISNDLNIIPSNGILDFTPAIGVVLNGGSNSPELDMYTGLAPDGTGVGSAILNIYNTGIGNHVFDVQANSVPGAVWLDPYANSINWFGGTSGNAQWGVAAVAGTPNKVNVPLTTGLPGQHLQTDGGSPQQTSWVSTGMQCGTIAANGACTNILTQAERCVSGIATLTAGASTITGIFPAFTSSSSYFVITNDVTTIANPSKGVPASSSSITFTGTGTDNIQFIACGG